MTEMSTEEILYNIMADLDTRDPVPSRAISRKIMIISTPRCGSTLFCDVVNNSLTFGECREWFNLRYIEAYAKLKQTPKVSFSEYLDFVMTRSLRGSSTFVVNMHIEHLKQLKKQNFDPFTLGFDEVFYLRRRNKLQQAISLARALQTDQWTENTKSTRQIANPPSYLIISKALAVILDDEQYYRDHLQGSVLCEFEYEVFRDHDNPDGFARFFNVLGIKPETAPYSEMKKQSDSSSEEISMEFLNFIQGQ